MNGQEELQNVAEEIKLIVQNNPCAMSDTKMKIIAAAIRLLIRTKIKTDVSKEDAARYLHVSPRQLQRLVSAGKVPKPQRFKYQKKAYFIDDLDQYLAHK